MANQVLKKSVYYIYATLASPLALSMGDGTLTDQDVLRNFEGEPFVPGSSIAGAMRAYIEKDKTEDCIFGFGTDKGKMSSAFVSDFLFEGVVSTRVRDSVKLRDGKIAETGAKFDMEVIDTGAKGYFTLELITRERDNPEMMEKQIKKIFLGWQKNEIRLGSKKTRGYGEIQINDVFLKEYTKENILEYKEAYLNAPINQSGHLNKGFMNVTEEYLTSQEKFAGKYLTISMPLRLQGGISIRQYVAKKEEPDFVHVTANNKPVVPGTSFTGAIRSRLHDLLIDLKVANPNEVLQELFGMVSKETAKKSKIVISECIIENAISLTMVRNGISRFESGTKDGALFKERSYVGGETTLHIQIQREKDAEGKAGLVLLVLKDIAEGLLAVGGQTSVGRGIFVGDGNISIENQLVNSELENHYFQKAYAYLSKTKMEDKQND